MIRYYFHKAPMFYALDIWADDMDDAKEKVEEYLGTLKGVEIWKAE